MFQGRTTTRSKVPTLLNESNRSNEQLQFGTSILARASAHYQSTPEAFSACSLTRSESSPAQPTRQSRFGTSSRASAFRLSLATMMPSPVSSLMQTKSSLDRWTRHSRFVSIHDSLLCSRLPQFWSIQTGVCVGTLDWVRSEGHKGVIRNLKFDEYVLYNNPKKKKNKFNARRWLMISAADDKTIKIWNVQSGQVKKINN